MVDINQYYNNLYLSGFKNDNPLSNEFSLKCFQKVKLFIRGGLSFLEALYIMINEGQIIDLSSILKF